MRFAFTDEQQQLRNIARKFLANHSSSKHVREAMETESGWSEAVWQRVAGELGWPALAVPEAYGGYGFGFVEVVALMEEMGRVNFCSPYLSSSVLAANAILLAGNENQKQNWLPELAAGSKTGALAWMTGGDWQAAAVQATWRQEGSQFVLDGQLDYVIDGHTADIMVVAAREVGSDGQAGISLFVVPGDTPGMSRTVTPTLDPTRKLASLRLKNMRVDADARLRETGEGWKNLAATLDLARIALAAEQVGGAQACLDTAVDYAKVREQFSTPIGKFQAIKHKCADMMVKVEAARSAAYYAGWAAANAPGETHEAALIAQAYCSEAFFHCASENIQIHGGIGFTWEHDAHLYFKRAKASEEMFGAPAEHRRMYAQAMGF